VTVAVAEPVGAGGVAGGCVTVTTGNAVPVGTGVFVAAEDAVGEGCEVADGEATALPQPAKATATKTRAESSKASRIFISTTV
jgi:hypothetical protein